MRSCTEGQTLLGSLMSLMSLVARGYARFREGELFNGDNFYWDNENVYP